MASPTTTPAFLLFIALLWAIAGASHAAPPVVKPKMVPRPVPGMSNAPAASRAQSSVQTTTTRKLRAPAPTEEPVTDDVRILQIFRQGTIALPPANPALTASPKAPSLPQTATDDVLRSGRVRILTQAEAEVLAAQSR